MNVAMAVPMLWHRKRWLEFWICLLLVDVKSVIIQSALLSRNTQNSRYVAHYSAIIKHITWKSLPKGIFLYTGNLGECIILLILNRKLISDLKKCNFQTVMERLWHCIYDLPFCSVFASTNACNTNACKSMLLSYINKYLIMHISILLTHIFF